MKKQGRGFIWTKADEDYLKKNYATFNKADLLCYFNGRNWNAIIRKASKLGLKRDRVKKYYNKLWDKADEQYLKDNYKFGDLDEIAKKLNRTRKAITERAKLLKITRDVEIIRRQSMKYCINENFFKIWSYEMAYILGLICADGNISQSHDGNKLSISLHRNDRYLIKNIYKTINSTHKIYDHKNKKMSELIIENKHIYNDLLELGIIPNKSKTLGSIDVPKKYIASFILGVLDGDGSVSSKRKRAKICTASKKLADCLSSMLNNIGIDHKLYNDGYKYKNRKENFYVICILKRKAIKRLYTQMYKDCKLYLKRKKQSFEKMGVKNEDFIIKCKSRYVPVKATNFNTGEVIIYPNIKSVRKEFPKVFLALKTEKAYKGYIWEYVNKEIVDGSK